MFHPHRLFKLKKKISIGFKGFWRGFTLEAFKKRHPYLLKKYKFIESTRPQYLFVSVFKNQIAGSSSHHKDSVKIFYTGENIEPDMGCFDYAFSFSLIKNEDHYRLPCWIPRMYASGMHPENFLNKYRRNVTLDTISPEFCSFIIKNRVDFRERFFSELNLIKPVMAPGLSCNNVPAIGPSIADKIKYQKKFRFSIALENECSKGYVTEKITEAFAARTVPIYMGDSNIRNDFNEEAFINISNVSEFETAIERIIQMDDKRSLYLQAINSPVYAKDSLPEYAVEEKIMSFFERIFG